MDLELREALALSEDRRGALAHLLPGSEQHDYFRALHAQHAGRLDEAQQILDAWPDRHGNTAGLARMRFRQLLCRVATDPAPVADQLADELGVQRWHEPVAETVDPTRATKLAEGAFDGLRLLKSAVAHDSGLGQVTDEGLHELLGFVLDAPRRRSLLSRIHHTPNPRLVELVADDLGTRGHTGFGSVPVHQQLTLAQLFALGRKRDELRHHLAWVSACVRRMRPHHTVDLELDRDARAAYLAEVWAFLEPLPPAINSLKGHVLWHVLDLARRRGEVDPALVRAYLAMPRNAGYLPQAWVKRFDQADVAQVGADFREVTGLAPAGSDEELVRDLLQRDLARADQYSEFFDRAWFDVELASAALLAGFGDPDRATRALGPARAAALRDRVELAWNPAAPVYFGASDAVALEADVKNVPEVVVKIFRIDPVAYFHHHKREVNTDLDLDGLAASHERTLAFTEPAVQRVRRRIELPECARPGTYVVDLIGNGMSSRALVHKGRLRHVTRVGAAGHVVALLDEAGAPRPDARAWIGEREYTPDERGTIVVPFSTAPGRTPILLVAADLASVGSIELVRETYALALNLVVDREGLAAGRPVKALARLSLTVAGMPAALALVKNPTWDITLTDRHGVATTKSQPLVVTDEGASVLEWTMPDDIGQVSVTVRGKVHVRSEQRDVDVSDARHIQLSTIHGSAAIEALYLADTEAGWVLSALGKTGEPRAARPVTIMLVHRWARWQLDAELASDAAGRIELGHLPGVEWISATLAGTNQPWLAGDVGIGATVAVAHGRPVLVPVPPRRTAEEIVPRMSLVELRAGVPARHPEVEVEVEPLASAIAIRGLPMGEYELRGPGVHIAISVAGPGPEVNHCAVTPGEVLQTPRPMPAIGTLDVTPEAVTITLRGASSRTRVHVIGTRFVASLVDPIPLGPAMTPLRRADRARGTYYVSGRELGDEYRYVLERRNHRKWPSLLLDKPSLLLNPWSRRTTSTAVAHAAAGGAFRPATPPPMVGRGGDAMKARPQQAAVDGYASFDFVPQAPAVLANLVADEAGVITIARDQLGDAVTLTVIVDDPAGVARRHVALPERLVAPRDLRLRVALAPERHAKQDKAITPLVAGGTLVIEDLATAKVHLIDSVEKAHAYLLALRDDPTLRELAFVTRWPALPDAERRELYSKHACHELHLFLYFKDRAFFDAVIAPYLAHKRIKTFVDHWLLGTDLAGYLEPAKLGGLNAVERALLALRMPADAALPRILEDQVATMAPDPALDTRLVDALLGASALDGDPDLQSDADADEESLPMGNAYMQTRAGSATGAAFGGPVAARAPRATEASMQPPPAPMAAMRMAAGPGSPKASMKAKRAAPARDEADDLDYGEEAPSETLAADLDRRAETQAAHYRAVDKTQEWAESNWWKRTAIESSSELIGASRLWRDLARAGAGGAGFLSRWLGLATGNFAEAMCALAVTDLPFVAAKHDIVNTKTGLTITARGNALAGSSQIVDGELVTGGAPLVVGTSYVRTDDRSEWSDGEQRDKYVDTFIAGVVYTCLVVLANPTSSRQRVAALVQIPRGSIAVAGARATQTIDVVLAPYGTHGHEYSFYFPVAGSWTHFPVHASRGGVIVAAAPARLLEVTASAAATDTGSWAHVSQRGTLAEVLAYLATANLVATDLSLVAWRLKQRADYDAILGAIDARHGYHPTLWGYSLVHRDGPRIVQYLRTLGDRLLQGGPAHELLGFDSEDTGAYEHLELSPLVNARAHRLGGKLRILNDGLARQYDRFLELVTHRPQPLARDLLAAAAYFLAQDRAEDAIAVLARVDAASVPERMQHAYLAAYVACLQGHVDAARELVTPWVGHPVDRWRHRFAALRAMLDEVAGGKAVIVDALNRDQQQAEAAAQQPTFELEVDREGIAIRSQHLKALDLRFFEMDVELLFSRQPFVQSDVSRFSFIEPGAAERLVDLPPETRVVWPAAMRGKNVVVEGVAAGQRKAKVHYANDLALTVANHLGQVRAVRASDGKPLSTTYVKVYARKQGGGVAFYKDGYTDLRGWFDYASLSTTDLDLVERFALLVSSETAGASIVEAAPPQR